MAVVSLDWTTRPWAGLHTCKLDWPLNHKNWYLESRPRHLHIIMCMSNEKYLATVLRTNLIIP